mmetsp:Transcript_802/g.1430  ORF Transcript_802/g.1430 Transcript_802/m.1430 type:complete len:116 (+) Transcript_802:1127-1474(+)|eukprot:CAMPEP_0168609482 /NCGR_PEP_ID=MMETSP0449_2-20121227/1232_1 /TAXON_ID=1082188 /ORGANISM="Strombidium rassoulzadegani, Strain ras09" /LENGTH=115 /DNA_ID=CAMNT_0008649633 /DNA_START=1102 /DNA_END=1449 /DNA_ORIENTATION=-
MNIFDSAAQMSLQVSVTAEEDEDTYEFIKELRVELTNLYLTLLIGIISENDQATHQQYLLIYQSQLDSVGTFIHSLTQMRETFNADNVQLLLNMIGLLADLVQYFSDNRDFISKL